MSVVATGSVTEYFLEIVGDAIKARRVDATEGAQTYLVSMLADYARPDARQGQAMERPLSFLLDEALHTVEPAERFDRLRSLGDAVLYTCGFFGEHFEARGVETTYVIGIGATAYDAASTMLHLPENPAIDVYGELASKFPRFVEVITDVADATIATSAATSEQMVKLYERWLKTGSDRIAHALSERGIVPTRGAKGGVLQ